MGTTNHCVHGKDAVVEEILDWRPPEYFTVNSLLPIPNAPKLRSTDELFDNEHLNAIDFFETVDTNIGEVRFPGIPTWFSATPGEIVAGAPLLGQHTEEVLHEVETAQDRRRASGSK